MLNFRVNATLPDMINFSLLLLMFLSLCSCGSSCPTNCNCTGTTVNCQGKNLQQVPAGIPSNTKILLLSNNVISEIQTGVFANLSNLNSLQLTDNKLTNIAAGALNGLTSLQKLYLARNQVTDFPDICEDASGLTHLGLDENKIEDKDVPVKYEKCKNLRSLVLTKNTYSTLKNTTLQHLKAIQSVKLNSVKMKAIQPGAFEAVKTTLKAMDFSDNDFNETSLKTAFTVTTFANIFNGLTLKNSKFNSLPDGLFPQGHFPKLDVLHLDGSQQLKAIEPDAFVGVASITQLFLSGTQLQQLQHQLIHLKNLKSLKLANSAQLKSWTADTFDSLTNLQQLDLSAGGFEFIGGVDGSENPLKLLARGQLSSDGLDISRSSLKCDCRLLWLTQQLLNDTVQKKVKNFKDVKCQMLNGTQVPLATFKPQNCTGHTTVTPVTQETPSSDVTTTEASSTAETAGDVTTTPGDVTTSRVTTEQQPQVKPQKTLWLIVVLSTVAGLLLLSTVTLLLLLLLRRRRRRSGSDDDDEPLLDDGIGCLRLRRSVRVPVNTEPEYIG